MGTKQPPREAMLSRGRFIALVAANVPVCAEHNRLTVRLISFPPSYPGQFVQVLCRDAEGYAAVPPLVHEWPAPIQDADVLRPLAYLRRPYSIAARRDVGGGGVEMDLLYRVSGKGTRYLAKLKGGQEISILGPMGKGFWIPDSLELALLVGGGVGIPPMFYLADALALHGGLQAIAFVGAQRKDLLPLTFPENSLKPAVGGEPGINAAEFAAHGFPAIITTDDGSLGMKGFITAALRQFLTRRTQAGLINPERTVIYVCGPTPMMKAAANVAAEFHLSCQVSLEQPMACGMGTCQSCVIKYQPPGSGEGGEWVYKLTCTDGPVFDAGDLRW